MIDTTKKVVFYDDRSKDLDPYEMRTILFENEEICLCTLCFRNTVVLFNKKTGEVLTSKFQYYYAQNE